MKQDLKISIAMHSNPLEIQFMVLNQIIYAKKWILNMIFKNNIKIKFELNYQ